MDIRAQLAREFKLGPQSLHGPRHWHRVETFGLYLARTSEADPAVVSWFAWLHDCRRVDESRDAGHGARGAARARELAPHLDLTPAQLELLYLACEGHEWGHLSRDATIGTCYDADRLDLDRVLLSPDPQYMSTAPGRHLATLSSAQRWQTVGLPGGFRS